MMHIIFTLWLGALSPWKRPGHKCFNIEQDWGDHSQQLCIDLQWPFPLRGQDDPTMQVKCHCRNVSPLIYSGVSLNISPACISLSLHSGTQGCQSYSHTVCPFSISKIGPDIYPSKKLAIHSTVSFTFSFSVTLLLSPGWGIPPLLLFPSRSLLHSYCLGSFPLIQTEGVRLYGCQLEQPKFSIRVLYDPFFHWPVEAVVLSVRLPLLFLYDMFPLIISLFLMWIVVNYYVMCSGLVNCSCN